MSLLRGGELWGVLRRSCPEHRTGLHPWESAGLHREEERGKERGVFDSYMM